MADQTFTFQTKGDWETGDLLNNTIAYDPAGKLIPSLGASTVAQAMLQNTLAVYCRVRDGSGTTIANLGEAGDGTLTGGTWGTKDDGRSKLTGGSISIAYHSSMAKADADGKRQSQAGGIRVKYATLTSEVLMSRSGRFTLGINAEFRPYILWVHNGGSYTITAPAVHTLEVDIPMVISFSGNAGTCRLYVNGVMVAEITGLAGKNNSSGALTVQCSGEYSDFFLFGDSAVYHAFAINKAQGSWEKIIDLGAGEDCTLRHLTIVSEKEWQHSISISVSFSNRKADIDTDARKYNFSVDQFTTEKFYPPETNFSHGRYMRVYLSLNGRNYDSKLPLVESMTVVTRDVGSVAYEEENFMYDDLYEPIQEEKSPENLEEALAAVKKLQADIREVKQRVSVHYSSTDRVIAPRAPTVEELARMTEEQRLWREAQEIINSGDIGTINVSGLSTENKADLALDQLRVVLQKLADHEASSTSHACTDSAIACQDWVTEQIANHSALRGGVHGVDTGDYIVSNSSPIGSGELQSYVYGWILNSLSDHQTGEVYAHEIYDNSGVDARIALHNVTTGVHGVGASTVASLSDISNHASLGTDVHGIASANGTIKGSAQIMTIIEGYGYASASHTHSGVYSEVLHAADAYEPSGTVATHAGLTIAHGSSGVVIGATTLNTHMIDTSTHGVSKVADDADIHTQSEIYGWIGDAFSDHQGDSYYPHPVTMSAIATHAGYTTGVHGL